MKRDNDKWKIKRKDREEKERENNNYKGKEGKMNKKIKKDRD